MSRVWLTLMLTFAVGSLAPGCEDLTDVVRYEDGEFRVGLPGADSRPEFLGTSAQCDGLFDVLMESHVFDEDGIRDVARVNATLLGPDGQVASMPLVQSRTQTDVWEGEFDLQRTEVDCNDDLEVRFRVRVGEERIRVSAGF
jgi:hypothetical protein